MKIIQANSDIRLSTNFEVWPLERLTPYAENARTHSEEQIAQVAASIVQFGFTNPILVSSQGVVIAGHARLAAAREGALDQAALDEAATILDRLGVVGVTVVPLRTQSE